MNAYARPLYLRSMPLWATLLCTVARGFAQPVPAPPATDNLMVTVSKSLVLDSQANIQRVSVANGDMAEAVVINPREVMVNGKTPGDTSLIIWQQGGFRMTKRGSPSTGASCCSSATICRTCERIRRTVCGRYFRPPYLAGLLTI